MATKIAFVTYETPYAPCGGIAAVMRYLPDEVRKASDLSTMVLTPYHHRIAQTNSLKTQAVMTFPVWMEGRQVPVSLEKIDENVSWYFLRPEEQDWNFFEGFPHPYHVGGRPGETQAILLRDALFFGVSVVRALNVIDNSGDWILLLQDWQAATVALALTQTSPSFKLFLTLHNSYDSGVSDFDLGRVGIAGWTCPGSTVLTRAIPFIRQPVFTVSDQFADDLFEDLLQVRITASHLGPLRGRVMGVNNGPFTKCAVGEDQIKRAELGEYVGLSEWKVSNRQAALQALEKIELKPVWGNISRFDKDKDACWFVMAGRDDPLQKGYDVAALAVRELLEDRKQSEGRDIGRFLFFPIPGDEGLEGLGFLRSLAEEFPENVLVMPFVWREGFLATLRGATYGLMPSLYEPFGAANEFYLNGTVGIGRATGGIVQQISPVRAVPSFSQAAMRRSQRWHAGSVNPTGLLFRERDGIESALSDWYQISLGRYDATGGGGPDRVQERRSYPLFRAICGELKRAMTDGISIYKSDRSLYYRMLTNGIRFIQRTFSWDRAAHEYARTIID